MDVNLDSMEVDYTSHGLSMNGESASNMLP